MKPVNLSMISISPISIGLTVIDKGTKRHKLKARSYSHFVLIKMQFRQLESSLSIKLKN